MAKATLTDRPIPVLDPVNDGRHELKDGPLERESIPYVIVMPELGLATFTYTWVTKANRAGSVFVVFGPGVGGAPIVESIDEVEVKPGQNFDDWKVGKVHLRQDLQLKTSRLSAEGERAALDITFEAAHPAYAYGVHPEGCPDYAATNRLEQAGRVRGTIRIDGKTTQIDTTGARDHSWGTRDWQTPQHWKWLHAQAGPETCVHFWQINARGKVDLRGYVLRDGKMSEVTAVEADFKVDKEYRQTHIDAVVTDAAGRTTRVKGEYYAVFPLLPGPHTTLNEGAMRCTIEGKAGSGWSEFMWPTEYLGHLKAMAK